MLIEAKFLKLHTISARFLSTIAIICLYGGLPSQATSTELVTDSLSPDTIRVHSVTADTSGNVIVPVDFFNDELLSGIEITLIWGEPLLQLDSFSFVGSRIEYVGLKGYSYDPGNQTIIVYGFPFGQDDIPTGNGLLGRLCYSYPLSLIPDTVSIDSTTIIDGHIEHGNFFSNSVASHFVPRFVGGRIIFRQTCCVGTRGNMDGDPGDFCDISDLTHLADYIFLSGPPPFCNEEANLDESEDNFIDISDLTFIVDYIFRDAIPPPPCP